MAMQRRRNGTHHRSAGHRPAAPETEPVVEAQIVYLLPEGYDPRRLLQRLLEGAAAAAGLRLRTDSADGDLLAAFEGRRGGTPMYVEVRHRTATLRAPSFAVRRDLLERVMDLVAADV